MGDVSVEPSMEDILSSIKRIIAEEGEGPIRARRPTRPVLPPLADDDDSEVLELSDPLSDPLDDPMPPAFPVRQRAAPAVEVAVPVAAAPIPPATPIAPPPAFEAAPVEAPAAAPLESPARMADPAPESILSHRTAEASRSSLDALSRLLVKPEPGSDGTLEGMVREMLRPMLREWLDANLPSMVETMVAAEIARIGGQSR